MFGSASRGQPDARDLDIAVGSHTRTGLDAVAVICALMDLVDSDHVDLLDLDRAGPVARQHALVPGDPLYEYRPGETTSLPVGVRRSAPAALIPARALIPIPISRVRLLGCPIMAARSR
jgi:hypothetical protein